MTKSLKLITLILAAIFLITGTMMVAFAEGEDVDPGAGDIGGDIGGDTGGGDIGGDTGGGDIGGDTGGGTDIGTDTGGSSDTGSDTSGGGSVDYGSDTGSGYSGGSDYSTGSDYSSGQSSYQEDPIYYGSASDYDYNSSSDDSSDDVATTDPSTLYTTSGISDEEVAPNEWSEITLDEKSVSTGVTDFSSIKTNTETSDDSQWILYVGYGLIALAIIGIIYFIVSTIIQRKKNKKDERIERRRTASPARSTAARMEAQERRNSGERVTRYAEDEVPRSRRAKAKADTGEIYVPRRASR